MDVAVEVAGSRFQRVRVAQHAIQDYFPAVWRMMRATVIGEEPR